jgi:hypothetical protein
MYIQEREEMLKSLKIISDVINHLRTEVYLCHQNQNAKNIGNFTTLLKPHNIGTHLKGIETSFQVVSLFLKSFHIWVSYITFCNFTTPLKAQTLGTHLKGIETSFQVVPLFMKYFHFSQNTLKG